MFNRALIQRQSFRNVLQNTCSKKFHKFHLKTPALESFLIKLKALNPATLFKKDSDPDVFP